MKVLRILRQRCLKQLNEECEVVSAASQPMRMPTYTMVSNAMKSYSKHVLVYPNDRKAAQALLDEADSAGMLCYYRPADGELPMRIAIARSAELKFAGTIIWRQQCLSSMHHSSKAAARPASVTLLSALQRGSALSAVRLPPRASSK